MVKLTVNAEVVLPVRVIVKAREVGPDSAALVVGAEMVTLGSVGAATPVWVTSIKLILLLLAPLGLLSVSRPSVTVTLFVPSTKRDDVVGVPSTTRTLSALILK